MDLVQRARAMAQSEARAGIGKIRRDLFEELADEIKRLQAKVDDLRMECGNLATVETVREVNAENRELKTEIERLREALEAAMSANYERRKWP
jgi:regulator of replication initiation timing